jgi:hypothetical protein
MAGKSEVYRSDCGYNGRHGGIAMRIRDWSRVPAGLFHDFHQSWSIGIKDALRIAVETRLVPEPEAE